MAEKSPKGLENIVANEVGQGKGSNAINDLKQQGENLAATVDGFFGDALRTGVTTYSVASTLPVMLMNPIAGAAYAAIAGFTSYVGTNLVYKLLTGTIKFAYDTLTNPFGTLKGVTDFIKSLANPLNVIKNILATPEKIYKHLFEGGNHNKLGQLVGTVLGGGAALNVISPDALSGFLSNAGSGAQPIVGSLKEGVGAFGAKMAGLGELAKDSVHQAGEYIFLNDPIGNLHNGIKNAYDYAFVYK